MISAISGASVPSLTGAKSPPENLSAIIEDKSGKYSDEEKQVAFRKLEERDQAGFFNTVTGKTDPWSLKDFYSNLTKYVKSLSPEEQESERYRGQVDLAKSQTAKLDAQIASGDWDPATKEYIGHRKGKGKGKGQGADADSNEGILLEALSKMSEDMRAAAEERLKKQRTSSGLKDEGGVNVTLSAAAQKYLEQLGNF